MFATNNMIPFVMTMVTRWRSCALCPFMFSGTENNVNLPMCVSAKADVRVSIIDNYVMTYYVNYRCKGSAS